MVHKTAVASKLEAMTRLGSSSRESPPDVCRTSRGALARAGRSVGRPRLQRQASSIQLREPDRQIFQLLEPRPNHCKQTGATRSNRQFSQFVSRELQVTNYESRFPGSGGQANQRKRSVTPCQVFCDLTQSKQRIGVTKKCQTFCDPARIGILPALSGLCEGRPPLSVGRRISLLRRKRGIVFTSHNSRVTNYKSRFQSRSWLTERKLVYRIGVCL